MARCLDGMTGDESESGVCFPGTEVVRRCEPECRGPVFSSKHKNRKENRHHEKLHTPQHPTCPEANQPRPRRGRILSFIRRSWHHPRLPSGRTGPREIKKRHSEIPNHRPIFFLSPPNSFYTNSCSVRPLIHVCSIACSLQPTSLKSDSITLG